ncbi:MAG TPA: choice-of-anchor W domain-containing protein [Chroococcidiopsis sp.]
MNWKALVTSASILGVSTVSLAITAMPAAAAQLTLVPSFGGDATELWKLESMIGGSGKELFLATDGSNGPTPSTADWTWADNSLYNWQLNWDGNFATFTLFSGAFNNSFSRTVRYDVVNTPVNGLEIKTRVDVRTPTKVAAGTIAKLALTTLNGSDITSFHVQSVTTGIAGKDTWTKVFVASNDFLQPFTLRGTALFDWPSFNPQTQNAGARLEFQLEANYDPRLAGMLSSASTLRSASDTAPSTAFLGTATKNSPASVPEPNGLWGLSSIVLGLAWLKRNPNLLLT